MLPPTVAVVHHDPAARAALQQALTARGYQVLVVEDAACAYRVIRQQQPAVVVLAIDAGCPDAGWKVVQLLWLDRATAQLPLVVCTPPAQRASAPTARLQRRGLLLATPYSLPELLERVQAAARPAPTTGDQAGRPTLHAGAEVPAYPDERVAHPSLAAPWSLSVPH